MVTACVADAAQELVQARALRRPQSAPGRCLKTPRTTAASPRVAATEGGTQQAHQQHGCDAAGSCSKSFYRTGLQIRQQTVEVVADKQQQPTYCCPSAAAAAAAAAATTTAAETTSIQNKEDSSSSSRSAGRPARRSGKPTAAEMTAKAAAIFGTVAADVNVALQQQQQLTGAKLTEGVVSLTLQGSGLTRVS